MSAPKKSSLIVLCLSLAVTFTLGVLVIIDATSADASQSDLPASSSVRTAGQIPGISSRKLSPAIIDPALQSQISTQGSAKAILLSTAVCLENLSCGGTPCPDGANNVYGNGRIDAFEAVSAALGSEPEPDIILDPLSFSATLTEGGIQTDTLTISNAGDITLTVQLHEYNGLNLLGTPRLGGSGPGASLFTVPSQTGGAIVEEGVRDHLLFLGHSRLILYLHGQADLTPAYSISERTDRVQYVYVQLRATAALSDDLFNWLSDQGSQPRRLMAANAIAATLDASQLEMVLRFPQVKRVGVNGQAQIMNEAPVYNNWLFSPYKFPDAVEWNIAKIRADETWATFGVTGQGAVIGVIDTGVRYTHAALVDQYRGNLGGGNFDHDYSWYDLIGGQTVPYDDHGHGTFGIGLAVGDDGGSNQIGVAPGAKWIAVKALTSGGSGTYADLQAALDWMLAPTDVSGNNPDPGMAPQVVLNMWGFPGCDHDFDNNIAALRAANILPVFAPGGMGPSCGQIASPAANPEAITAGATDSNDNIGSFSARGPSCYDGSIKPDVAAPGVNVRSSTSSSDNNYAVESGTSFSTAHLAGAGALLFSANPYLGLDDLEQTLFDTAVCYENLSCGGTSCPDGANNVYGNGRIDVFEAISSTLGLVDIPWLVAGPLSVQLLPGESITTSVVFTAASILPGTYTAGIAVESNDPDSPNITLPVTLTVVVDCQPVTNLDFSFSPEAPLEGEVITFTASASGTLPTSYTWIFDDGGTAAGAEVTHVYESPGEYTVTVTGQNTCSQESTSIILPIGEVCQPVTDLNASFTPGMPLAGEIITFTASASGSPPISYTWNFDDGTAAQGPQVEHVFNLPGMHLAEVTAQNSCSDPVLDAVNLLVMQRFWLPFTLK